MSEIISKYEPLMESLKQEHHQALEKEIAEKERIQVVFKERFQEDLQDTAKKLAHVNLMSQSRQSFAHIEELFPFKLRRGTHNAEAQCDLDGLGSILPARNSTSR